MNLRHTPPTNEDVRVTARLQLNEIGCDGADRAKTRHMTAPPAPPRARKHSRQNQVADSERLKMVASQRNAPLEKVNRTKQIAENKTSITSHLRQREHLEHLER